MTDIRANDPALDDEDRLPWLEAVEEDDEKDGPGAAKLIAFVVIGLIIIGLVVGGVFWMRSPASDGGVTGGNGQPEVIAAPEGDYKVKPTEPGGMKVEGKGDTAFATSEGADPKGQINTDAVAETPVTAAPKQQPAQTAQAPAPQRPAPAAPTPAPAQPTAGGGGSVQLGAFSSQAGAEKAWKALSGRFTYLAPLSHSVVSAKVGGKTVYRLRAGGPDAKAVCGRLRVAGESCVAVQ